MGDLGSNCLKKAILSQDDSTYFEKKLYFNLAPSLRKILGEDFLKSLSTLSFEHFKKRFTNTLDFNQVTLPSNFQPIHVLTIHQVNKPFLLDSLLLLHEKMGLSPCFIVHPVFKLYRDDKGTFAAFEESYEKKDSLSESLILIGFNHPIPQELLHAYEKLLLTVHDVVNDFPFMLEALNYAQTVCLNYTKEDDKKHLASGVNQYLSWLENNHFVFLGMQVLEHQSNSFVVKKTLGLFKTPFLKDDIEILPELSQFDESFLSLRKISTRSIVHRSSRITLVEVAIYDPKTNKLISVYQFAGLFTKKAYHESPFLIPLLKEKLQSVFSYFGYDPTWYDGKLLASILETIPQDELYLLSTQEIQLLCDRVLKLSNRVGICCHLREEPKNKQAVLLIFISKESFSQEIKSLFKKAVEDYFQTTVGSVIAHVGDAFVARLVYVFPYEKKNLDLSEIEAILKQHMGTWSDRLLDYLEKNHSQQEAAKLYFTYGNAFSKEAQEHFSIEDAYSCIDFLENIYQGPSDGQIIQEENRSIIRLFTKNQELNLSKTLEILTNMGFSITSQSVYSLKKEGDDFWIQEFSYQAAPYLDTLTKQTLREMFLSIISNNAEDDKLNALIQSANLTCRQISHLRTYLSYLSQSILTYSQSYMIECLRLYPTIIKSCLSYFEEKFDPTKQETSKTSKVSKLKKLEQDIFSLIREVSIGDHDRILRALLSTMQQTVRTNAYQKTDQNTFKNYISIKLSSKHLSFLPDPKPLYDVFVYASFMQGIHLRSGKVARGGIRWSDRHQDFRTEVLSLMKAQTIKNAVIVPSGSKGGFIVKNLSNDPKVAKEQVINAYQTLIKGLLDITDNYDAHHKVVHPKQCVLYDSADPYLVVAADKGTATFSDCANSLSKEYGFWLDDAFASGGSDGYDHKKLGITARGAWESVKRHFKELGIDCQTTPFTAVGVGDMAGDVFGNGMLQSKHIKLQAAFNHKHIFLDPTPDAFKSYQERKRLFEEGLGWDHYNKSILSNGGGVFERSLKFIPLSKECQKFLGTKHAELSPEEVIKCLLKSHVDLLWFGGIGTYIKEKEESHAACNDHSNDSLRVNSCDVNAKIIAEGANLAMTQKGRVSFALKGGRLNTDTIDNSAGVDCSDHEVNIKILLQSVFSKKNISQRNQLLKEITDDVCSLVLKHNHNQARLLSTQVFQNGKKTKVLFDHQKDLSLLADLHPEREGLPTEEILETRAANLKGYTRPELAILCAYTKNHLVESLKNSSCLDTPWAKQAYKNYFPKKLQPYTKELDRHPLKQEITATVLADDVINTMGLTFFKELSHYSLDDTLTAYHWVKSHFCLEDLEDLIESSTTIGPSLKQLETLVSCQHRIKLMCQWVLQNLKNTSSTGFKKSLKDLMPDFDSLPSLDQKLQALLERSKNYQLILLSCKIAADYKKPVEGVFDLFQEIIKLLPIESLFTKISKLPVVQEWEDGAKELLIDELYTFATRLVEIGIAQNKSLEDLKKMTLFVDIEKSLLQCLRSKDLSIGGFLYHLRVIVLKNEDQLNGL